MVTFSLFWYGVHLYSRTQFYGVKISYVTIVNPLRHKLLLTALVVRLTFSVEPTSYCDRPSSTKTKFNTCFWHKGPRRLVEHLLPISSGRTKPFPFPYVCRPTFGWWRKFLVEVSFSKYIRLLTSGVMYTLIVPVNERHNIQF